MHGVHRKRNINLCLLYTSTPAAVISNGTLAAQRKCIGTLADIGEKIEEAKLTSPAISLQGQGQLDSGHGRDGAAQPAVRPDGAAAAGDRRAQRHWSRLL